MFFCRLYCQSVLTEREPEGLLSFLQQCYRFLLEFTKRTEEGHRIISTCLLGEITSHVENDRQLLQNCINAMLGKMGDQSLLVRMQAIKGSGNLASSSMDDVRPLPFFFLFSFLVPPSRSPTRGVCDNDDTSLPAGQPPGHPRHQRPDGIHRGQRR